MNVTRLMLAIAPAVAPALLSPQRSPTDSTHWTPGSAALGADVIGDVTDAASDSRGRVYVADRSRGITFVLDRGLRVIGSVGKPGGGPGEHRELLAVRPLGSGSFATIDRVLRRIYIYRWSSDRAYLAHTVRLPFEPYDFCPTADGRFTVLGYYRGMRLHEVDSLGSVRSSAAAYDRVLSPMLIDFIITGRIACLRKGVFVLTSEALPTFEVYSGGRVSALARVRSDSIWPVRRISITQGTNRTTGRKSMTFSAPPDGYHSPDRAVETGTGFLIPAVIRGRGDRKADDTVGLFAFSSAGAGVKTRSVIRGRVFPLADGAYLSVTRVPTLEIRVIPSVTP